MNLDESVVDKYNPKKIHIHISSKVEMNVYIYAGKSKMEATESVVLGNEQASVGQTYSVSADKGFLIVAYPNENKQTEFGFNYWLEAEVKPAPVEEKEEEENEKEEEEKEKEKEDKVITGYEVVEVETIDKDKIVSNVVLDGGSEKSAEVESDDTLFFWLCAGAGVLFIAIIVLCIKCRNKGKI